MNKYRNKPTIYNNIRYASKLEAGYAKYLDILLAAGKIKSWQTQPRIPVENLSYCFSTLFDMSTIKGKAVKFPEALAHEFNRQEISIDKECKILRQDEKVVAKVGTRKYLITPSHSCGYIHNVYRLKKLFVYIADFLVTYPDNSRKLFDTKGAVLQSNSTFIIKQKTVEAVYNGIEIVIVDKLPI